MLSSANQLLAKLPRTGLIALALLGLGIVGVLDYLTGYEISFAVFYLVPVSVVAWYGVRSAAFAFALGSSLVWYGVEVTAGYPYPHAAIPVWNACVRLAFFLIVASLLGALRERLRTERLLANTDAMTGVLNSRAFMAQLGHDLGLMGRSDQALTLAYVDLDNFKRINDKYGHGSGDHVLRHVGQTLRAATRHTDTIARLGGDEFALILPGTDMDGAAAVLAKLRQALAAPSGAPEAPLITCSIGAVVFRHAPQNADEAIAAADRLMYQAKAGGKDAVTFGLYTDGEVVLVPSKPMARKASVATS